ncbi:RDD family protein [Thalassorhabdomicrobium marinisediminis]|uniref:RDD family protein n=1 Tax=Thalassorhabdomicrobium marinisediminis TaxID=2170577 RepID=UPI002490E4DD|nr:RDD family protein [Thalassorhabdomicrobium marinisediminis]
MTATFDHQPDTLPAEFYEGVLPKRLFAWLFDVMFTALLAAPLILPLALIGALLVFPLMAIPVIWAMTGFLYRWITISNRSATWGMRLMAIELRDHAQQPLSSGMAFLHTLGSTLSFGTFVVQALSVLSMIVTEKGQGLTDLVLGTTMLNRSLP